MPGSEVVEGDLISRAALLKDLSYCAPELWQDEEYVKAKIMKQPAVDAAPAVHGQWDLIITKHYGERWQADAYCSCCDFMKDNVWSGFFPEIQPETARTITRHYAEKVKLPAYCERCGAKMGGDTE